MNEPRRLLEDAPDQVTAKLLSSAGDDDPSERAFERTAAALGVIGGAQLVSGSAAAQGAAVALKASTVSKLGGIAALKSLGVGVTAGLLVAGGAALVSRVVEPKSQPMAAVLPAAQPAAPAARHSSPVVPRAPAATANALPVAPQALSRTPSATAAPAQRSHTIASEIAALDRARSALRAQDPRAALRTLDELERSGATALAPEAAVLRVEALLARGDAAAAGALARAFIAENPRSPHAERMREIAASAR